jgi:hypothetical protein
MTEHNPIIENKQLRKELDVVLQKIKASPRESRERHLAIINLEQSVMWLGMDLKALNEPNPYPNSKNPLSGNTIDPTADGLKL